MATNDQVTTDPKLTDNSIDPNVRIPDNVKAAAAQAEAFYRPANPEPGANPPLQAEHNPPPAADATLTATDQNPPSTAPAVASPTPQELQDDSWAARYNSMKGRWEASQRQVGSLQQQLVEAGDEMGRLHAIINQGGVQRANPDPTPSNHKNVITDEDRETYGEELLDTVARVAKAATQPELDALRAENERLKKNDISMAQRELRQALAQRVPNWTAIQASDAWKAWLRLPNVYTGQVRGQMLKAAYDAADAPKVIALFQDFTKEVQATGGTVPTNQRQEQQAQPAPRQPAVSLESLAAPGRARPASGDSEVPAEKPIITRADIARFYADSRKGAYAGREAEYRAREAEINAAQRDGRIRG